MHNSNQTREKQDLERLLQKSLDDFSRSSADLDKLLEATANDFLISNSEKRRIHGELLQYIQSVLAEDISSFDPFIAAFEQGINDKNHYNRAIRRLCTSPAPKVRVILEKLIAYRHQLGFSFKEVNRDGKSALDYAEQHNPAAYQILQCVNEVALSTTPVPENKLPFEKQKPVLQAFVTMFSPLLIMKIVEIKFTYVQTSMAQQNFFKLREAAENGRNDMLKNSQLVTQELTSLLDDFAPTVITQFLALIEAKDELGLLHCFLNNQGMLKLKPHIENIFHHVFPEMNNQLVVIKTNECIEKIQNYAAKSSHSNAAVAC